MSVAVSHCESCSHAAGVSGWTRVKHLGWAGGLLGVFPLAYLAAPVIRSDTLPICPFRCVTGQPCPFCGLTRAFAAATHLQWHQALHFNPLWPVAAALVVLLSVLHLRDALTSSAGVHSFIAAVRARWIWIVTTLILFDVWRVLFPNP